MPVSKVSSHKRKGKSVKCHSRKSKKYMTSMDKMGKLASSAKKRVGTKKY